MPNYSLKFHSSPEDVEAEWRSLETLRNDGSIFETYAASKLWYDLLLDEGTPLTCSLWSGDVCIGIYPLVEKHKKGFRLLGTLYNEHFSFSLPLVRPGFEVAFPRAFLAALSDHGREWDVLKLSGLYSFGVMNNLLGNAPFPDFGHSHHIIKVPTYTVDLGLSFEEYLSKSLTRKTRKNFRQYLNRIKKIGNHEFLFLQNDEALSLWRKFLDAEADGWKGQNGSALKNLKKPRLFFRELAELASRNNAFHLSALRIGGEYAAFAVGFSQGGVYHGVKCGYLQKYAALSPFNTLLVKLVEHLTTEHPELKLFNMFPNDYGYKHRYAEPEHCCSTHVVFNATLRGRLAYAGYSCKMRSLPWMRRWRETLPARLAAELNKNTGKIRNFGKKKTADQD